MGQQLTQNLTISDYFDISSNIDFFLYFSPEVEFKEFEPHLKFETWLKHGWFHLKLYSLFQNLSWRSLTDF